MPQPDHATDSPLRALTRRPALQQACVQERCRTRADGMEVLAALRRRAAALPALTLRPLSRIWQTSASCGVRGYRRSLRADCGARRSPWEGTERLKVQVAAEQTAS